MSKNKMITLGEKLHTGEISPSDERIKKAEQCIAQLFKTEAGREEIAEIVGITQNNVRVKMTRIREKLRRLINDRVNE